MYIFFSFMHVIKYKANKRYIYCSIVLSVALFVVTEPPAHQQIKRADTVPLSEIACFSPPPPQRGIFFLIP